jgi:DNA-binding HxlR family transcriptional regulator
MMTRHNPERAMFDRATLDPRALDAATRQIGDRWTLRIVGALLDGGRTFGELTSDVEGIAPNILTTRLRALQRTGLLTAEPYERRPLRVRYTLTEPGRRLAVTLGTLADWGARREGRAAGRYHEACGGPVELRPWCPTCERLVDDDETPDVVWC